MKATEYGRAMLEMLGVLAIIGILTVGGIAGYTKAMSKYRIGKTKEQIMSIVTNVRTLYMQQISYKGLNNKTALQADIFPFELTSTAETGKLKNLFGGEVFVGDGRIGRSVSGIKNDHKAFLVEYTGLPRNACVDLAGSDWGGSTTSGLMGLKITGSNKTNKTKSTVEKIADVSEIQFQAGGVACDGSSIQGELIACVGGAKSKLPVPKAQAVSACNCGSTDNCAIVLKYF